MPQDFTIAFSFFMELTLTMSLKKMAGCSIRSNWTMMENRTWRLHAFIIGVNFEDVDLDSNLAANQVMVDFDTSQNSIIENGEFINGILRWLEEAKRSDGSSGGSSKKFLNDFHQVNFFSHMFAKLF
jgi:hypothetical protein